MHLLKYLPIVLFLLISTRLLAQDESTSQKRRGSRIIDDTTRQVYGPNTTKYFYEEDVFYNRNIIRPVDTLIRNFHRWNYVQRFNNLYQDLGNVGMAIRPIYFQSPYTIGVRSGMDVYNLYWDTERVRYFDTKSPYTNLNVVIGGKGRSSTKVTFSRNISPQWNFGFNYKALLVDKQVPQRTGKGDRVTKSTYYDAYTAYHTKDSTYRVFMNFQRMFHRVFEPGGVDLRNAQEAGFAAYFDKQAVVWLSNAESNDLRMNFHLSQQFQVGRALQLYHTLDRYRQVTKFHDLYNNDQDYFSYVNTLGDAKVRDTTNDVSKFKVVRNEVGIKGNLLKLFYNGYFAVRHYNETYYNKNWYQDSLKVPAQGNEPYVGGRMELRLDSIGVVNGWVESLLPSAANPSGNLRIQGNIVSRWFDGSLQQLLYKPSFAEQAYIGKHNIWNNTFDNIQSTQLSGHLHYRSKVLNVSPGLTFTRLGKYIFFQDNNESTTQQRIVPVQSAGSQVYFSPELKWSLTFFRHVTLSNQIIYTVFVENADNAIRLPQIFTNTQLSYANIHVHGNLDMHAGVDVHWRSAYYAQGYDPAVRQFYNQDKEKVNAFPIVDLFFDAKIKRGRVFIKYNNLFQAFTQSGYLVTPGYPGQRNILDFGFDLFLFD